MWRPASALVLAAVMSLSVGACSDSTGSGDADQAVGVYTLVSIDGFQLPVIVDQQGNDIAEVLSGSVTLDGDLSFDDTTDLRITEAGVVTTETDAVTGTWALSGRTVQFNPNDGSADYTMSWDGNDQITQLFNGFTLIYRR